MKLTAFFLINLKKKITIILVMLPLKTVAEVEEVVLVILTFLVLSQIFLRTFLEKVLVEAVDQEGQIIEGRI